MYETLRDQVHFSVYLGPLWNNDCIQVYLFHFRNNFLSDYQLFRPECFLQNSRGKPYVKDILSFSFLHSSMYFPLQESNITNKIL